MNKEELCIKCQYCCKIISFYVPYNLLEMEFYRARGLKVRIDLQNNRIFVVVPQICQHLRTSGCAIYKKRPLVCSQFDGSKSPDTGDHCLWNKEAI
jgi:Fe-S-cluster containining protein